jgi:ATP-dependent DNA ligase
MDKTKKKVEAVIDKYGFIWAEPKLDGERAYLIFPPKGEEPYALSRTGLELPGLKYLLREMEEDCCGHVVDIEACGENWNKAISLARAVDTTLKKLKREGSVLHAVCFDKIPYAHYKKKQYFTPYEERRASLKKRLKKVKSPYIHVVDQWKVKSWKEAKKLAADCVEAGYEGIVMKVPGSPYLFRRCDLWMRLKTFRSVDVPVVAVKRGKPGTKLENTMGHLVIKYKGKKFGIGTGFDEKKGKKATEKSRSWLWKHRKDIIGRIVEVKVQEAPGFDGLLRPPLVFRRFREDKRV